MLTLSVGKSGEEDFFTIQEALDSIPYEEKAVITVKEGIYREKLFSDSNLIVVHGFRYQGGNDREFLCPFQYQLLLQFRSIPFPPL